MTFSKRHHSGLMRKEPMYNSDPRMDTAVKFSLLVFKNYLVERRVRIGGSEDKIEVMDSEASVIKIIVLITPII